MRNCFSVVSSLTTTCAVCILTMFKMLLNRWAQPRKSTTNFEQNIILCHNVNVKENVLFESATKIVTKKEQAFYITFSQSDWFIAQNERFRLAITTRKNYLRWLHLLSVFGKTFCFNFGKRSCCHFECIFSSTVYYSI